jgi:hypothetical protein
LTLRAGTISNATWAQGKYGTALKFTGATNSSVSISDASSLDLPSALTLEAWVNPSSLNSPDSNWVAPVAKDHPNSSNDISYALYAATGTGTPPGEHILAGGTDVGVSATSKLALDTWTFLAATYDGASRKIYVNGSLIKSKAQTGSITEANAPLKIGGDWSGEMFTGAIDNVRLYNRALSATEIQSDMNTAISARPQFVQTSAVPSGGPPLTPQALPPVVAEAIALWGAAGVSADRLQVLRDATIRTADLPTPYLGLASGEQIWISQDADGYGWWTDPSPKDSPAPGKVDLLTVVLHEMGHVLGLEDDGGGDVMAELLAPGVRLLPGGLDLAGGSSLLAGTQQLASQPLGVSSPGGTDSSAARLADEVFQQGGSDEGPLGTIGSATLGDLGAWHSGRRSRRTSR